MYVMFFVGVDPCRAMLEHAVSSQTVRRHTCFVLWRAKAWPAEPKRAGP